MKIVAYVRGTKIYDDSRATKEIMALADAGYKVVVLGWDRNGESLEKCQQVFKAFPQVSFAFHNVRVEGGIGIRNVDKMMAWILWIRRNLKHINPEIVHACDLDAGIGAMLYCKFARKPLVYDIYDYYIDTHHLPSTVSGLVEKFEIAVINFAQLVIICTEERREQIAKAKPQKVIVIHNSPEIDTVEEVALETDYVYCGGLNNHRLIMEIFEGYNVNSDLKFEFAGYGKYREQAERLAESYENFAYLGSIPYTEVLHREAATMAIAAIYEPVTRNHRLCAPNKFYEALALAKPVIVCRGTGIDKVVEERNIGIVINYSAEEFYRAIRTLKANPVMCAEMGQRARKLYEDNFRWSKMKEILLNAYGGIV